MSGNPLFEIVLGLVFGLTWYLVSPHRPERVRNAVIAGTVFGGLGLIVAFVRAQT